MVTVLSVSRIQVHEKMYGFTCLSNLEQFQYMTFITFLPGFFGILLSVWL